MSYSSRDDSDFADLPEYEFQEIPLLKRKVSKKALEAAHDPQMIRDIEHGKALDMIAKQHPWIPLDLVKYSSEYSDPLYETTLYYLEVVRP